MRDVLDLARRLAEANYCVPVKLVGSEKGSVAYELPEEFSGLLLEDGHGLKKDNAAIRRQVKNQGGWGVPQRLDFDEKGRTLLWVQLYKDRRAPGEDAPVLVKFVEARNGAYRALYVFRADRPLVLEAPKPQPVKRGRERVEGGALRPYKRTRHGHQPNPEKEARLRAQREERDRVYREALAKNPNQQVPDGPGRVRPKKRFAHLSPKNQALEEWRQRPERNRGTPCPKCNARPGAKCVDTRGRELKRTHAR